jgi:hypothetical protein
LREIVGLYIKRKKHGYIDTDEISWVEHVAINVWVLLIQYPDHILQYWYRHDATYYAVFSS